MLEGLVKELVQGLLLLLPPSLPRQGKRCSKRRELTAERWEKLQAMRAHGFTMPMMPMPWAWASYPSVCEICGAANPEYEYHAVRAKSEDGQPRRWRWGVRGRCCRC